MAASGHARDEAAAGDAAARGGPLCALGDDILANILSFLPPCDVGACACTGQRLRQLCADDLKVWLPMCNRRWGRETTPAAWLRGGAGGARPPPLEGGGEAGPASFRSLYKVLDGWEPLIGFWRGVGEGSPYPLVFFRWRGSYIEGLRAVLSRAGSDEVAGVPFLALGVRHGALYCHLDTACDAGGASCHSLGAAGAGARADVGSWEGCGGGTPPCRSSSPMSSLNPPPICQQGSASPQDQVALVDHSPWALRDLYTWQAEVARSAPLPPGVASVRLQYVGDRHIVVQELEGEPRGRSPLAEAAALASFGSEGSLVDLFDKWKARGGAEHGSPSSSPLLARQPPSVGRAVCSQSPPGSLPYEMCRYLSAKVASPGRDRLARRQKKRDQARAGRAPPVVRAEHFSRVDGGAPTKQRPLQGLWKGLNPQGSLDVLSLSYEAARLVCRRVAQLAPPDACGSGDGSGGGGGGGGGQGSRDGTSGGCSASSAILWTAEMKSFMAAPLTAQELALFRSRSFLHPDPGASCPLSPRSVECGPGESASRRSRPDGAPMSRSEVGKERLQFEEVEEEEEEEESRMLGCTAGAAPVVGGDVCDLVGAFLAVDRESHGPERQAAGGTAAHGRVWQFSDGSLAYWASHRSHAVKYFRVHRAPE